jgi:hypothetical protein
MPAFDKMKIADIIAKSLGSYSNLEVKASPSKTDMYDISITGENGKITACSIISDMHEVTLEIMDKYFSSEKAFLKWLEKLEYQMEQVYLSNIKTKWTFAGNKYTINIEL